MAAAIQSRAANGAATASVLVNVMAPSTDPNVQLCQRTIVTLSSQIARLTEEKGRLQLSLINSGAGAKTTQDKTIFEAQLRITELSNDITRLEGEKVEVESRCSKLESSLQLEIAQKQAAQKSADTFQNQASIANKKVEHLETAVALQTNTVQNLQTTSAAAVVDLSAQKREKIVLLFKEADLILDSFDNAGNAITMAVFAGTVGGFYIGGPLGAVAGFVGGNVLGAVCVSPKVEDYVIPFCKVYLCISDAKKIAQEIGYAWPPVEGESLKKRIDEFGNSPLVAMLPLYSPCRVLFGLSPSETKPILGRFLGDLGNKVNLAIDSGDKGARIFAEIMVAKK
jgi:hypothetical protein